MDTLACSRSRYRRLSIRPVHVNKDAHQHLAETLPERCSYTASALLGEGRIHPQIVYETGCYSAGQVDAAGADGPVVLPLHSSSSTAPSSSPGPVGHLSSATVTAPGGRKR